MAKSQEIVDVLIIGAGAAGLMCAHIAGKRGRKVLVIDHAKKPAEKIRISGGGRCNFTNIHSNPSAFLSDNPHFCKSVFARYTQHDFIEMVERHNIAFHEKKLGQLFCDDSAQQIITMLLDECHQAGVEIRLNTKVESVQPDKDGYQIAVDGALVKAQSVVVATGGLSIPKIGATRFGYDIARQFGLAVTDLRPALVPLTFQAAFLEQCKSLAGLAVDAEVIHGKTRFREGMLFTHRGLSGPSILQISSYWTESKPVIINMMPDLDVFAALKEAKSTQARQDLLTALSQWLPRRLAAAILDELGMSGRLADQADKKLNHLAERINRWQVMPSGTEGYRTAEVTLGGVHTSGLSAKTMEARSQKGLFFIGEVVDLTGHLGGYNFQWAWSSGFVAGEAV